MTREGIWRLVRNRAELLERGLRVIAEGLELGSGGAGFAEGLLRDAGGTPALAFATDAREATLPARVLAAYSFWRRNATGMARALPEADLRGDARCRLLVVGTGVTGETLELLDQLHLPDLEVLEIDSFVLGGQERLVVRSHRGAAGSLAPIDASVDPADQELLGAFVAMVAGIDPRIRVDGDRYSRRVLLDGRNLGQCSCSEGRVTGAVDGEPPRWLQRLADVRQFVDRIARHSLDGARSRTGTGAVGTVAEVVAPIDPGARSAGFDALRASLTAARLSREESSALTADAPREVDPGPPPAERVP